MANLQPGVGDAVRVRQRTWVVRDVDAYEQCRVLTLAGATATGLPHTQRVIQPFDDVEAAGSAPVTRRVGIRAWRHACRALLLSAGPSWGLRTAAAAGMDLLPYQLEPTLALLRGHGCRLLIADDVGLGKTVQAMLATAELRARGVASRVLIVCPAGLREQWAEECQSRFHLPLVVVDQSGLRRARTSLPAAVNPWTTEPLVAASIDFIKRPEVLPSVLEAHWDLVVVDEVHGACGQSDRHDAVSSLCARIPYVLLLSATPHNGDEAAFASLCRLGRHDDELIVFRRTRREAGRDAGRRAHTVRVTATAAEHRMHAALAALTRAIRREAPEFDRSVWLMLSLLHKRALSSPYALAASAERRLQLLADPAEAASEQLALPWDDENGELDGADAAPMWGAPALKDQGRERRMLEQLLAAARHAEGAEGKLRRLRRLLRAAREPVIIFTEYRDTLLHVRNQVAPHAVVVHGGMTREQRRAALAAFPSAGILLATDAAGEGLNLQHHCRCVINLELPWNPMRLEQRIGRVDRIGQRRRVHVFHLVSSGSGESRLLERLSARVAHANARVGAPDPLNGRAEWNEESFARLIVLREEPSAVSTTTGVSAPPVPLMRLQPEGECEAARIGCLRTIVPVAGPAASLPRAPAASRLVARARRRKVRQALRGRTLAVIRETLSDDAGGVLATRVSGATVDAGVWTDVMSAPPESVAGTAAGANGDAWFEESTRAHTAMTTKRLERARSIAALFQDTPAAHQPGLFDRRTERGQQQAAEAREAARAVADERVSRAARALRVHLSTPDVVLVLTPRPPRHR